MNRHPSKSRGFTLLELIVAMMMVSIIAAALYQSLNAAFRAKRRAEATIVPIRAAGIALDIIARDLDSVLRPHPDSATLPNGFIDFLAGSFIALPQGSGNVEAGVMSFFSLGGDGTPDVPLSEGVRKLEIGVSSDVSPPALVRRITRNLLSGDELQPAEEEELLCPDVRSFTLRFFDGIDWYDSWDSTTMFDDDAQLTPALPMVVQIELVIHIEGVAAANEESNTYRISKLIPIRIANPVVPPT